MLMYLIVNNDLSMKKGKIAAQVGHAVGLYVDRVYTKNIEKDNYDIWMNEEIMKIVLKASEQTIRDMLSKDDSIIKVIDNGHTQIAPNSLTVICLGIDEKENMIKKYPNVANMQLL